MRSNRLPAAASVCLFVSSLFLCSISSAQAAPQDAALPNAPSFSTADTMSSSLDGQAAPQHQDAPADHQDLQQKRIFGIIPNFKAVSAGTKLPPQTVKDKFVSASQDSFDYSSLTLAAVVSLESYATDSTPEFHTGGVAYGRYFWHTYLDEISENYFVEFIIPTITHEDTRYYSLGHGGFAKRSAYSLSRAFITQTNDGRKTFNFSEIVGAGARPACPTSTTRAPNARSTTPSASGGPASGSTC